MFSKDNSLFLLKNVFNYLESKNGSNIEEVFIFLSSFSGNIESIKFGHEFIFVNLSNKDYFCISKIKSKNNKFSFSYFESSASEKLDPAFTLRKIPQIIYCLNVFEII